jgi:hypothetical protein
MYNIFDNFSILKVIDLRVFKTDNTINMWNMFYGSSSLISIDSSKLIIKNVIYFDNLLNVVQI